jgi:hypothetical protein
VIAGLPFAEIWAVDFEFNQPPGCVPVPLCMVALELKSGRYLRLWQDELRTRREAPIATGASGLFVAFYASAEVGCFHALGWEPPRRILDLFVEFRASRNGTKPIGGWGLLSALEEHGLAGIGVLEKEEMRDLAIRGGPFTAAERQALIDYCQTDVDALAKLLPRMLPGILERDRDLRRAVHRGRYMRAAGAMEHIGTPIDMTMLPALRENWEGIKLDLIAEVDRDFGVFEDGHFKLALFEQFLDARSIPWPRTPTGRPVIDKDVFKEAARAHPELRPLKELRATLSELRLHELAVGPDGRNRTMLSAFGSKTGRNQPSASKFVFAPAKWVRSLIKPEPGTVLAYIDWSAQEVAIAAHLSGDPALIAAVETGDPYLGFAVQVGLAPEGAVKKTHNDVRELCKILFLGIGYGMAENGLARRMRCQPCQARELLALHRRTYPRFAAWSDGAVVAAQAQRKLVSPYGWPLYDISKWRTLRNFPVQSAGADMLRLACILGTEAGIKICAPVHDAVMIETVSGPEGWADIAAMRQMMNHAARLVLDGASVRTDVELTSWPGRYVDERGARMWGMVTELLERRTSVRAG